MLRCLLCYNVSATEKGEKRRRGMEMLRCEVIRELSLLMIRRQSLFYQDEIISGKIWNSGKRGQSTSKCESLFFFLSPVDISTSKILLTSSLVLRISTVCLPFHMTEKDGTFRLWASVSTVSAAWFGRQNIIWLEPAHTHLHFLV